MNDEIKPREWFIQKLIAHNCPVGQNGSVNEQGAVFQTFMPTIAKQECEWVHVIEKSAYHNLRLALDMLKEICNEAAGDGVTWDDEFKEVEKIARGGE